MNESKPLTHSPFAALGGVRYPAHTPRPGMKTTSSPAQRLGVEASVVPVTKPVIEANGSVGENGSPVKENASEVSGGEVEAVGSKKKRRRRMHDAEFVERVIEATKQSGVTFGQVAKAFDVSPTLVSRWVASGVPRRGRKKLVASGAIEKFEASRVAPKAQGGVPGLDRICLLLEQSARLQAQSMELQRQALDEMETMGAALRMVFQGK